MLTLLIVHFVVAASSPALVRLLGRRAFWVLALPSAVTAGWALLQAGRVREGALEQTFAWVPGIDLTIQLRMDTLSWLLTLVISVIGLLVLAYCAGYFTDDEPGLDRFGVHLAAFAGAMLGLVWSDNLLLLYLFWELTTVLSYLLVGHFSEQEDSRRAATMALVVTTFGGLSMLVGLVLLGLAGGSYRLSELLASPPEPTAVVQVAIVLVLVGAISKSALVPFHFWLPGAMAAPTPVSAYLHAAAMVKAGVYLVARLAPGYATMPVWHPVVFGLGAATLLIGGYRALRQFDLKLLLAYGTVSQLGFLVLLVGGGTKNLALAGIAMLLTHSIFKACLFLTVGAIDHATGTRDLRILDNLRRRMPVLAVASTLAAASMAGVPPLLGFVSKEAAYAALLNEPGPWALPLLIAVVTGSVLTFGYSARFVWGAWGPARAGAAEMAEPHANPWVVTAVPVLLGAASLVLAPFASEAEPWFAGWVDLLAPTAYTVHLELWPGLNLGLLLSLVTLALGAGLFALRSRVEAVQKALPHPPAAVSAYRLVMRGLDRISLEVTGLLHRGSLPLSLSLILVVLLVGPGAAMVRALNGALSGPDRPVRWFDTPAQVAVAIVISIAAIAAVRSRRRFRAVFLVGVTGYGVALLFLLQGSPDLALTQLLVETVSVVVFILVLRRFTGRFRDTREERRGRPRRILLGVGAGVVVAGASLVAATARTATPDSVTMPRSSVEFGGGYNVVNVILVDIRAWDTMGEISVVLVAATGIASLIFQQSDRMRELRQRLRRSRTRRKERRGMTTGDLGWLSAIRATPAEHRSLLLEVVTRLIFHTVMVWSAFLLFTGHNDPGGGFAAGLVAGLALTIRYLAGGAQELRAALPVMPGTLLGIGLFLSAGFGLISMLVGGDVLQSWTFIFEVPLIGEVKLVTSMFFDIGVYLVVIGLMLDILRSLGSGLDSEIAPTHAGQVVSDPLAGERGGR
ncbi:Na+/H+ antiporter subunit A [Enemella evansiae]|uniref:Na+/H+ antiporter subunit A n=1 Tax=Enemella evansiae TaxID=2016499 RepID=UPI000B96A8BE|nr:Na+/H+ antiporter subunit A [Enemella evansiae]OYO10372.1 Na+/H+ antiporter subunit A [Enemella evansiae]